MILNWINKIIIILNFSFGNLQQRIIKKKLQLFIFHKYEWFQYMYMMLTDNFTSSATLAIDENSTVDNRIL